MRRGDWLFAVAAAMCLGLPGCGDDDGGDRTAAAECDPLAPSYCGFPYPNDHWTVADPDTPTGKRLALPEAIMPETVTGKRSDPAPFNVADGFSPGIAAMTHMPGATTEGLPTPDAIAESLAPDSPTVILDAETGERVPHWVDLDWYVAKGKELDRFDVQRPDAELLEEQTLMLRPAVRPEDSTRYIVAIRDVVDDQGTPLPPSPAFEALRNGESHPDVSSEREAHYDDIFARLDDAGIARDDLQVAWDYTTASRENNTQWMLHIRDDAFAAHPDGVPYEIEVVPDDVEASETACRLEISFEMPLYTKSDRAGDEDGATGATLNFGADGMPEQNGTSEYSAAMVVPLSAQDEAAGLSLYGHGMLGLKEEVVFGFQEFANQANIAMFALDWKGFAADDMLTVVEVLSGGDLSQFRKVPERSHQGFLNFLMAMRTLSEAAEDGSSELNQVLTSDCGGAELDGSQRYYAGASQGGILGTVLMAVATDIERGFLAVPGQSYNLMMPRSVNFDRFAKIVFPLYDWNGLDMQMNLALIQGLWDRAEPTGYSPYVRTDTLPGTPPHEVMLQVSASDHQVTELSGHLLARSIGGVINLETIYRDVWGLDAASGPHTGSVLLESYFGNDPIPLENIPPWEDSVGDPHGRGRDISVLPDMASDFFRGSVTNLCDGYCDQSD